MTLLSYHSSNLLLIALKAMRLLVLIGPFREKYVMFDLKKYGEIIFHDTREWWTYGLQNNMRNLANFHQSTWNVELKIGTFMESFYSR